MASALDQRHAKQQYRFPLSPPSSGNVSASSSPRLVPTLSDQDPQIIDKLFSVSSSSQYRQSHSLASVRLGKQRATSNTTDSDGYNTETTSSRIHSRRRSRRVMSRALTLPSASTSFVASSQSRSPQKSIKPIARNSSISSLSSSSSSSATPTDNEEVPAHHATAGIGRKVAATLQLFKETAGPSEESSQAESSSRGEPILGSRRKDSFEDVEDVPEAYEFVKRSEWPDRESAALRREKSMTTLERVRTRESSSGEPQGSERKMSLKDPTLPDVVQWRKDIIAARGRRRERVMDDLVDSSIPTEVPLTTINHLHETSPIYIRPRSRAYPPSPSPSRSPSSRVSLSRLSLDTSVPSCPESAIPTLPSIQTTPHHSRSPTPVRTSHHPEGSSAPISPLETFSPWSTDDESTWESASATSTAPSASTYGHDDLDYHSLSSSLTQEFNQEPDTFHLPNPFSASDVGDLSNETHLRSLHDSTMAINIDIPDERLPHIPLRPFRNQVGGHSAIYKFTKQAVCKVRMNDRIFITVFANFFAPFPFIVSASGFSRKSVL